MEKNQTTLRSKISGFFRGPFFNKNKVQGEQQLTKQLSGSHGGNSGGGFSGGFGGFSSGEKYAFGLANGGSSQIYNNRAIRQNAREMCNYSPEAMGIITRLTEHVVGTGLRLDSTPEAALLGISQDEADEWGQDLNRRFDLWARSKMSNRSQDQNFYQLQRLYQLSQQRDNDVFARLYYSKDEKLPNKLQVGLIDANQIQADAFTSTWDNLVSNDGIKRNSKGVEISYSVRVKLPSGEIQFKTINRIGPKSGRTMFIHGFMPDYANQTRGLSRLAGILQELENVGDFKLSTIKKQISQSQFTVYVKPAPDAPATNIVKGITQRNSGPVNSQGATTAVNPIVSEECKLSFEPIAEAQFRTPGSTGVFNLNAGEDLKLLKNDAPGENYAQYVDNAMAYISASKSVPIEVLLMKFGNNFSASRATLVLYWMIVEIWRHEMATDFLKPIWEMFLVEEIAAGRVKAPGFSDPVLRQAWLCCEFTGSSIPNIDPLKSAKAAKENIGMGALTLDKYAKDTNGSSGKANRTRLKKEVEELPFNTFELKNENEEELEEEEENQDDE